METQKHVVSKIPMTHVLEPRVGIQDTKRAEITLEFLVAKNRRFCKSKRGQSIVEMLLTLFMFFTIFFMFVQTSLTLAVANYLQYATFMSARAYLSSRGQKSDQVQAATSVFSVMALSGGQSKYASIIRPAEGGGSEIPGFFVGDTSRVRLKNDPSARQTSWESGASYRFGVRLYLIPIMAGRRKSAAMKPIELESQSWLGREPSTEECTKNLQNRQKLSGIQGGRSYLFDNGC